MKKSVFLSFLLAAAAQAGSFPVVDTSQTDCSDSNTVISAPGPGEAFAGQDAQYAGHAPQYELSPDGLTVYDRVTGLTWQQTPDSDANGVIDADDKFAWPELSAQVAALNSSAYGGFSDWYEYNYSSSTTGLSASADSDGDGASNAEEQIAGTVPTDAASRFEISEFSVDGGSASIGWTAELDRSYSLEQTTNLLSGVWITNGVYSLPVRQVELPLSGESLRFYRLRVSN